MMIRIGIVDDHAIVRNGLKDYFLQQVDFRVVGEGASGREAIDLVGRVAMDVMVLDVSMPGQSGIDAVAMIREQGSHVGILVLSGHAEEHYAVHLIRQGASGFLGKQCNPREIVEAIRTIAHGRRYLSASVAELLAHRYARNPDGAPHQALSEREFQVFLRLSHGERASAIATDLLLSIKTVSTYRSRIMEKMQLFSNSDLTYYALKWKLID